MRRRAPASAVAAVPDADVDPRPKRSYVYLVRCRDGSLYCGWTVDPWKRAAAHSAGKGAAYTRSRRPVVLAWYEECADKRAALRREYAIKRLTRRQKLALVASAQPIQRAERTPGSARTARVT